MAFTISIPHNSSHLYYPNNTRSSFQVHLPKEINLEGEYEVALTEILYTNNIYNINSQYFFILIQNSNKEWDRSRINLPSGYYPTPQSLLVQMKEKINDFDNVDLENVISFSFDEITNLAKIIMNVTRVKARIELPALLANMLGFESTTRSLQIRETKTSDFPCDMFILYKKIDIFTDIIERQIVGDKLSPLLRSINFISDKINDHIFHEFDQLYYIPVSKNNFRTIKIDIRTETGRYIPFESGEVMVSLHFRRKHI